MSNRRPSLQNSTSVIAHHYIGPMTYLRRGRAWLFVVLLLCTCDQASTGPEAQAVVSVTLSPATLLLVAGQSAQVNAAAFTAKGAATGFTVAWSSSDPTVATVSSSGLVTAVSAGNATVTALIDGQRGTAGVTVTPEPVATVTIAPSPLSLTVGQITQLTATPLGVNGNALSGRAVTWSSGNTAVATVSPSGFVNGVAVGSATINALIEGKSAAAVVTVSPQSVASVTVTPATVALVTGETRQLLATPLNAGGGALTGRVEVWSSSNAAVASVTTSGLVTALAPGGATISASVEGKVGSAAVTVAAATASIVISPDTATLLAGVTLQLRAMVLDANGKSLDRPITWSTGNASIATVSSTGLLTAVGDGNVAIMATAEGKSATAQFVSRRVLFSQLAIGSHGSLATCALTTSGEMYCWGNQVRLGDGSPIQPSLTIPVRAAPGRTFTGLTLGGGTVCGISNTAYCWGDNDFGQVGDGTRSAIVSQPASVSGGLQFKEISAGARHVCAVTPSVTNALGQHVAGGDAYCWGENSLGQLGIGRRDQLPSTTPMKVGRFIAEGIALPFTAIAAGGEATCALFPDSTGTFRFFGTGRACWGHNFGGELGIGATDPPWRVLPTIGPLIWSAVSMSKEERFACGIGGASPPMWIIMTQPRELYCWGTNSAYGILGIGSTAPIFSNDTRWGMPLRVQMSGDVTAVSAGARHACAIAQGLAYCWGDNRSGQLGDGTTGPSPIPVRVSGNLTFLAIAAGNTHTCGITSGNVTYCWGDNSAGQLGNGTRTSSSNPVRVLGNP